MHWKPLDFWFLYVGLVLQLFDQTSPREVTNNRGSFVFGGDFDNYPRGIFEAQNNSLALLPVTGMARIRYFSS